MMVFRISRVNFSDFNTGSFVGWNVKYVGQLIGLFARQ
jgi:hypothetical protein